jgi:hypothetical protein
VRLRSRSTRHDHVSTSGTRSLKSEARSLFGLFVSGVLPAVPAVLAHLETLGRLLPVFRGGVVATLTVATRERNDVSHARISNLVI